MTPDEPWEDIDACSWLTGGRVTATCGRPAVTWHDARGLAAFRCVVGRCADHPLGPVAPEMSREEAEIIWVMSR